MNYTYYSSLTLGIDFTARDVQKKCKENGLPWEIAKSFDQSAPLSKQWISFKDVSQNISFELEHNGDIVQKGCSDHMIFSFDQIIAYVSRFITLKKGDLIFTGTPSGVGKVDSGDNLEGSISGEKLFSLNIK